MCIYMCPMLWLPKWIATLKIFITETTELEQEVSYKKIIVEGYRAVGSLNAKMILPCCTGAFNSHSY